MNTSLSVQFHLKTSVCVKYFASGCGLIRKFLIPVVMFTPLKNFWPGISFLGKFGSLSVKADNLTYLNFRKSVAMFNFSVFDLKDPIWENLVQNSEWFIKSEISNLDNFKCAEFSWDVQFICFRLEIPFLGKFGSKTQTCQFKLKFGTYLDWFGYEEFNGHIHFFLFLTERILFTEKFV